MKIIITSILQVIISMGSPPKDKIEFELKNNSVQQLANSVICALQHESPESFICLLPSIDDFHKVMDNNVEYGSFLEEAKEEFDHQYTNTIVPLVYTSFSEVIKAGKLRGIVWCEIKFSKFLIDDNSKASPLSLLINVRGEEFKIILDKPLWINGELKISQFIRLV